MGFSKANAMVSKMAPATVRAHRGWWRPTAIVTLGALVLSSGFALSAQAATAKPSHPAAPGAIKLPKSSLKRVGGVVCGKVAGRWIPGTALTGGYFLSDAQQARDYASRARHETGGARKTDLGRSKLYTQRAKQRQPICAGTGASAPMPGASSTGAPAPSSPGTGGTTSPNGGSSTPIPAPPAGDGSSTPTPPASTTAAISVSSRVVGPGMSLPVTGSGFAPGSTVQLELHSTPTSLGSVVVGPDGTFSTNVTIPPTTEGGEHHILGTGIGADGGTAAPEAVLTVDASPPDLTSFSMDTQTIDTSTGPQTIKLTAHITDDLAGNAGPGYYSSPTQVRFVSPSGRQSVTAMLDGTKLVSGTPQSGDYQTTMTVPRYAEQGTWTVQSFMLVDQAGNTKSLTAAQMQAAGLPTTFSDT
jgi:hypothetical protein